MPSREAAGHPRVIADRMPKGTDRMTATAARTYDPIRFHRGTRGFAAFVTLLNGLVVLGMTLAVAPTFDVAPLATIWAVILGTAAGIAHLVAAVGLIRGHRWAASLVGYLAAAGIALAGFGALLAATGMSIFGADRATSFGFFVWMIVWWLVGARFAVKPFTFTPQAHRVMAPVAKPVADARPMTGARKRTVARPIAAAA
jgi:predicted secreted protein